MTHSPQLGERTAEVVPAASADGQPRPAAPERRERALFLIGLAAVALHVADDSFLQPQPGTSAGDHLVSGLVPLGVLALAAVAFPRLRGGADAERRAGRSAGSRPARLKGTAARRT